MRSPDNYRVILTMIAERNKEELYQLIRFAEIGMLSSEIFHDLISPLNSIMGHIDQLSKYGVLPSETHEELKRTITISREMGTQIAALRRQLQPVAMRFAYSGGEHNSQM